MRIVILLISVLLAGCAHQTIERICETEHAYFIQVDNDYIALAKVEQQDFSIIFYDRAARLQLQYDKGMWFSIAGTQCQDVMEGIK